MGAYREDRRTDAIRRLQPITRNEAAEMSDITRTKQYERAREEIADDLKRQSGGKRKAFSELIKKKK